MPEKKCLNSVQNTSFYKILKELITVRDNRRNKSKSYYRHNDKFKNIDNEMKRELKEIENNLDLNLLKN